MRVARRNLVLHCLITGFCLFVISAAWSQTPPPPKIAAPITEKTLGFSGPQASTSVMRIICWDTYPGPFQHIGTGFVHKSGFVVTAKHILDRCRTKDFRLVPGGSTSLKVATVEIDPVTDLALLRPAGALRTQALGISDRVSIDVGEKLHIWGFPDGYGGNNPLLTVGHLSGVDTGRRNEPIGWVVNAPFQSGTSGGPIVDANDGLIVGVVSGRINYFPPYLTEVLKSLKSVSAGGKYPVPADDGSTVLLTETQVIAAILEVLREERDRSLGLAVAAIDLRRFLMSKNIDP
jgi:hypothetical protein